MFYTDVLVILMHSHSSLASPDSEITANSLVLVAHGASGDLSRLEEMKISNHTIPRLSMPTYLFSDRNPTQCAGARHSVVRTCPLLRRPPGDHA
jgi:hypothetical protein